MAEPALGLAFGAVPRSPDQPLFIYFPLQIFTPFCNLHYYLPGRSQDCRILLPALSAFPANGEDVKLEEDLSSVTAL